MSELVKDFWAGMPIGLYLILILSIALMVASFLVPPLGVIAPSVLQGAGIILGATWLFYTTVHIPEFIERGAKIKAQWGNASLEIGRNKKKKQEEDGTDA